MNRKPVNSVGLLSLLMVFMVLCLATFAALALSTVTADKNLADRTQTTIEEYYQAQNQLQEFLFELDDLLLKTAQDHSQNDEEVLSQSLSSLLEGNGVYDAHTRTITYEQTIGARTQLSAVIELTFSDTKERYKILSFTCQPVSEQLDKTQNLWNGD